VGGNIVLTDYLRRQKRRTNRKKTQEGQGEGYLLIEGEKLRLLVPRAVVKVASQGKVKTTKTKEVTDHRISWKSNEKL